MFILSTICGFSIADEVPLWIGIVRVDGILVPIGTYKDNWVKAWPEISIDEQPEVDKLAKTTNGKMKLQDIPDAWKGGIKEIPAKVFLWSGGPDAKNLNVVDAEQYSSHCSGGWGLKTDLHPTETVDCAPTPKVGIAANLQSNIIPFEHLNKESEIPSSLVNAIKAKFEAKAPVELTKIYRVKNRERVLYFIEAQEKQLGSDPDCYNLNSTNNWVLVKGDKISFLSSELITTTCDSEGIHELIPGVLISVRGKQYIVSENYGYEWGFYTIHELLDESMKEVLNVGEGGC